MIPQDPNILLSWANTLLRDRYGSLEALCEDLDADEALIVQALAALGYGYDSGHNQFTPIA